MKFKSHFIANASIAAMLDLGLVPLVGFMVGSTLPDVLDKVFSAGDRKLWERIHRTLSHWPWAYAAFAVFAFFTAGGDMGEAAGWVCVGALVHLVLDFMTPMGIPVFPWSLGKRRSLRLVRTGSAWEYLFLLALVMGAVYSGYSRSGLEEFRFFSELKDILAGNMPPGRMTW